MSEIQPIVFGCGEFGAQVTAHLEARGMARAGLTTWNSPASTRQAGGELVRQRLESVKVPAGETIHLVAAADEAGGSGVLIAMLSALASQHECRVWLALPLGQADRAAQARVYATLSELEVLHKVGRPFETRLCERGGDPMETAQRFGDALSYHVRRQMPSYPFIGPYRAFGLGVVRDPASALKRRLAHRVVVRVVEQYLSAPDPAHFLPGLKEAFQRPIRPLLILPEQCPLFQQRWSAVTNGGSLEALLDYYEPRGSWYHEARQFWDGLVGEARKGFASAMGNAWRSGFEVVYGEAQTALNMAHVVLEAEIAECEQSVADRQEQLEAAYLAAAQGEVNLSELDRMVATYLLGSVRLGALERLALAIDGVVELAMDGLRAKAERVRLLLQAVQERRALSPLMRLAHALTMVPSAEQEQAWLHEIQPRLTRALLYDSPSPTVDMLLENGQRDVDRYIRTRPLSLHLPRGHRIREAWLERARPGVRLTGTDQPLCTYEVSPGLPAEYKEDLAMGAVSVHEHLVDWFPNEWVIYGETPPFAAQWLTGLPDWAEAYRAASPTGWAGLHVLPEPAGGWPTLSLLPEQVTVGLAAGNAIDNRQAQTVLRCILLGLVTPDGSGTLILRSQVHGWAAGHPVGGVTDLLAAVAAGGNLGAQLDALAGERRQQLPPHWLAGYYALLRWFQTAVLDGDRGGLDQLHLVCMHQAVETERAAIAQQLAAAGEDWLSRADGLTRLLGSSHDQVSMAAGPWRCLRPLEA